MQTYFKYNTFMSLICTSNILSFIMNTFLMAIFLTEIQPNKQNAEMNKMCFLNIAHCIFKKESRHYI